MQHIRGILIASVLLLASAGLPAFAQEISAKPSEKQLRFLQSRYEWAMESTLSGMHTMGHGYSVSNFVMRFKYSATELRDFGRWFLANAKTPLELEKAVSFADAAYKKYVPYDPRLSDKDGNSPFTMEEFFPERLYIGQAAMRVAEYYADKVDPYSGRSRATSLFYRAGQLGIQEGYLAAAYLTRADGYTQQDRKNDYDRSVVHSTTRAWAEYAYEGCNKENMSRQLFPWTQKMCDEAKALADYADADYQRKRLTYVNNGAGGAGSAGGGASLLEASIIILAGLAAATSGSDASSSYNNDAPSSAEIANYGAQAFIFTE